MSDTTTQYCMYRCRYTTLFKCNNLIKGTTLLLDIEQDCKMNTFINAKVSGRGRTGCRWYNEHTY